MLLRGFPPSILYALDSVGTHLLVLTPLIEGQGLFLLLALASQRGVDGVHDELHDKREADNVKGDDAVPGEDTVKLGVHTRGKGEEQGDDDVDNNQLLGPQGLVPVVDDDGVDEGEVLHQEGRPGHQRHDPKEVVHELRQLDGAVHAVRGDGQDDAGQDEGPDTAGGGHDLHLVDKVWEPRDAAHLVRDDGGEGKVETARDHTALWHRYGSVRAALYIYIYRVGIVVASTGSRKEGGEGGEG